MRFFHHKEQCYVVGEGSFVGHCGHLPHVAEDIIVDSAESGSLPRTQSITSLGSHEIRVQADVEPTQEDVVSTSAGAVNPSLSPAHTETQKRSLQPGGDSRVNLISVSIGDNVVSEDGELYIIA